MNLINLVREQLSGDVLDKLGAEIGADPESTGRAAGAAVPALLAGLTKLASNDDGIRKLTNILGNLDTGAFGNIAQTLGGKASGLMNQGMGLLGSLFGPSLLGNISSAIARYAGIDPAIVQKLVALIAPTLLGKVAAQWKSQGGTPSALANFLGDQARYIPGSLPPGFSLDQIPGLSGTDAIRPAAASAHRNAATAERAAPSLASWMLPLAGLLVVGFLLWQLFAPRPGAAPVATTEASPTAEEVTVMRPEATDMGPVAALRAVDEQAHSTLGTLKDTLASITDAASAEAAVPKLEELKGKIDEMKAAIAKLPDASKATLTTTMDKLIAPMKAEAQAKLSLPDLSERVKRLLGEIVRKLEEWHVISPAS